MGWPKLSVGTDMQRVMEHGVHDCSEEYLRHELNLAEDLF